MQLTCPKCQGAMRQYERNGVVVDQCGECRGIFLDRGELERLVDAENAWHAAAPRAQQSREHDSREHDSREHRSRDHEYRDDHYRSQQSYGHGHSQHKRHKSFLEDLFD